MIVILARACTRLSSLAATFTLIEIKFVHTCMKYCRHTFPKEMCVHATEKQTRNSKNGSVVEHHSGFITIQTAGTVIRAKALKAIYLKAIMLLAAIYIYSQTMFFSQTVDKGQLFSPSSMEMVLQYMYLLLNTCKIQCS